MPASRKLLKLIAPAVGLVVLVVAIFVLKNSLRKYEWSDIADSVARIEGWRIAAAIGAVVINYLILIGYERVAQRARGVVVSWPRTGLVAFCSYAFSHNIGYAAVSGGAVRYRLYSAWGLGALDIAYIIVIAGTAFWLGCLGLGGAALLLTPDVHELAAKLPAHWVRPLGGAVLGVALAVWIACALRRKPIRLGGNEVLLPRPPQVAALAILSFLDWLFLALIVWLLLPSGAISFSTFIAAIMLAQAFGVMSQVPGGIGVLEATLLLLLGEDVPKEQLVAAMLIYRGIYHLGPFALAAALLIGHEAHRNRHHVGRLSRAIGRLFGRRDSGDTSVK